MKRNDYIIIIILLILFLLWYGVERAVYQTLKIAMYTKSDSPYEEIIQKYATQYNLDPNLIKAIIMQESGYKSDVMGFDGLSIGLMQITKPVAADFFGKDTSEVNFNDFSDSDVNIQIGCDLLSKLAQFGRESQIMSYNEGHGNYLKGERVQSYYDSVMGYYDSYAAGVLNV